MTRRTRRTTRDIFRRLLIVSAVGALCACLIVPGSTRADSQGKWRLGPVSALLSTTDKSIKSTFLYDSDGPGFDGTLAGLSVSMPASESQGNVEATLNDFSNSWRVGPYLAFEHSREKDKVFVEFTPEWSFREYVYHPDFSARKESLRKQDWALGGSFSYYHEPERSGISAFQMIVKYGLSWEQSDAISKVIDTGKGYSITGKPEIIAPPAARAEFFSRLFYYREPGPGSLWTTGLSLVFAANSPSDGKAVWPENTSVLREELWLYYSPRGVVPANMRMGLGAFISEYLNGESDDGRLVVPGLLVQVKFGEPTFLY